MYERSFRDRINVYVCLSRIRVLFTQPALRPDSLRMPTSVLCSRETDVNEHRFFIVQDVCNHNFSRPCAQRVVRQRETDQKRSDRLRAPRSTPSSIHGRPLLSQTLQVRPVDTLSAKKHVRFVIVSFFTCSCSIRAQWTKRLSRPTYIIRSFARETLTYTACGRCATYAGTRCVRI